MKATVKQVLECNAGLSTLMKLKVGKFSYRLSKLARQFEIIVESYKDGDKAIVEKYVEDEVKDGKATGQKIVNADNMKKVEAERKEMLAKEEEVTTEKYVVTPADLKGKDDKTVGVSGEEMYLTDTFFDWSQVE